MFILRPIPDLLNEEPSSSHLLCPPGDSDASSGLRTTASTYGPGLEKYDFKERDGLIILEKQTQELGFQSTSASSVQESHKYLILHNTI